ncbi:hypothetical protein DL769_009263 [Monosporascus sp. CRB-8-3]|nr:hypothetical protein DL769_009263 [Monosporascus sp. CRB-8-3]
MAKSTAHLSSQVRSVLDNVGLSIRNTYARISNTTYKVVQTADSDDEQGDGESKYHESPLLSEVPNVLIESRRNGSIRWPSPYRGEPSYEVDKAWEEISIFRPLDYQLTDEEYLKVGISPETAARNAPEFGGGFFLQPEFSHQLHCVNLLRKASHFKYSYYKTHDPDFRDKDETFKVHLDHCVEMLRQFVMCHAEVGLVTAHWIQQRARPWPDFNTKQICRDFDGVLKWTREHQLPESAPMMPLKPEGAKALPSPP